LVRKGVETKF